MHLTLKREATHPGAKNLLQQQDKFDRFIHEYNTRRPLDARHSIDVDRNCFNRADSLK